MSPTPSPSTRSSTSSWTSVVWPTPKNESPRRTQPGRTHPFTITSYLHYLPRSTARAPTNRLPPQCPPLHCSATLCCLLRILTYTLTTLPTHHSQTHHTHGPQLDLHPLAVSTPPLLTPLHNDLLCPDRVPVPSGHNLIPLTSLALRKVVHSSPPLSYETIG